MQPEHPLLPDDKPVTTSELIQWAANAESDEFETCHEPESRMPGAVYAMMRRFARSAAPPRDPGNRISD